MKTGIRSILQVVDQNGFITCRLHCTLLAGLLLFWAKQGYGQQVESLQAQIQKAHDDSTRLRLYVQLADSLTAYQRFDSLYFVTQQAIPLAAALQATNYEGRLYYQLAMVYRSRRQLRKTMETLKKAQQLSKRANDVQNQARCMYFIATVYIDQGVYHTALSHCLTNLEFFQKNRLEQLEAFTYILLTNIHHDLGNTLLAKQYAKKHIQIASRSKDPQDRYLAYSNAAQSYEENKENKKALFYRQKAVDVIKSAPHLKNFHINSLVELAGLLRKQHQFKQAMRYLQDAAKISEKYALNDEQGLIWHQMALVQLELGHCERALKLAQRNVAYYKSKNLALDTSMGLKTLALVQERMGYYQQALQSYKEYHMIKDSLLTVEKSAQMAKVQALYELEKKENTIHSLQKKALFDDLKDRQQEQKLELADRQQLIYSISIGSLSLLILIVAYFLRRLFVAQQTLTWKKQRIETQAQQLQESNQLKDRLFSILGHDLRSPVASLKNSFTLLKLQNRYPDELTGLEQEVNGLSQILDNILYWSLNQQNGLKVRQQWVDLHDLVDEVLEGFTGFIRQKQLIIICHAVPASVWTDEHMTVLVLRNILHNACKFTPIGGSIQISTAIHSKQIRLRIADTGKGMSETDSHQPAHNKGTGIGLTLSKELMHLNGGLLRIESQPGQGTVVTLSWPNKST